MKIKELLQGYRVDLERVQIAGNMTVVPLVSDQEFTTRVGDVDQVSLRRDVSYGSLEFQNQGGSVGIVMQGATILTKQRAQDRTVPRAVIMKGESAAQVGAFCVESSQPGHINPASLKDEFGDGPPFFILPPTLRGEALVKSRSSSEYSGLWNSLQRYSGTFQGVRSSSELKGIYQHYKDSLDEFVAQFEPIDGQLGAIVLIDTDVVAVDILPTFRSWKIMWRGLIRDSYGAEAVRTSKRGAGRVWNYNFNLDEISDLDSLEDQMRRTFEQLLSGIRQRWHEIDEEALATEVANEITGVRLVNVESRGFQGQAVMHDEHCVYLSLIPKGSTREQQERFRRRSSTYGNDPFQF